MDVLVVGANGVLENNVVTEGPNRGHGIGADVSRDTAVEYRSRMVDQGGPATVETTEGTWHEPDAVAQFLGQVHELAETHS